MSVERQTVLQNAQADIPHPLVVQGLVDTGASGTSIDPSITQSLQLVPTGSALMTTPTTGDNPVAVNVYDVSLSIRADQHEIPYRIPNLPATATDRLATAQGFHVLIGRDVLSRCLLVYNGALGVYTLAF